MKRVVAIGICAALVLVIIVGVAAWSFLQSDWTFVGVGGRSSTAPSASDRPEPSFGIAASKAALPQVYASQFDQEIADGWSQQSIGKAPKGQLFLGDFDNETTSLRVTDLPPHALLRVKFDLYIINTWDGSGIISAAGGIAGPDVISVDVEGGPNLLRATFSNLPDTGNFAEDGKRQSYPWPIPSVPVMGGTGASGKHTLGYLFNFGQYGGTPPQDSTYTINCVFPHSAADVLLDFTARGLQGRRDESWGIANVSIDALPADALPTLDESALQSAWTTLLGTDPAASREAFWTLAGRGDATVRFLEKHAQGVGLDVDKVSESLARLEADPDDHALMTTLAELGPMIEPVLQDKVRERPQMRELAEQVLLAIETTPLESPTARQIAAASRLLGVIGTPEAKRVQTVLAERPSPAATAGSPEYDAEWKQRFNRVYRLLPDENLRYIPTPFIPEREKFLQERATRLAQQQPANRGRESSDLQGPIVARTAGLVDPKMPYLGGREAPKNLSALLSQLGLQVTYSTARFRHVEVPAELESVTLPGDWLIRPRTTQAKNLEALEAIIEQHAKRRISFGSRRAEVDIITVTGVPDVSARISLDPKFQAPPPSDDANERLMGMELEDLLSTLSHRTGVRFVDSTGAGTTEVRVLSLPSRNPGEPRMSAEAMQKLLDAMAAQTKLKFTAGRQSEEQYIATDLGPAK